MVDKNKAVVYCFARDIGHKVIRKECLFSVSQSSGNVQFSSMNTKFSSLLFILEGWVPWDDAKVVSAGKLWKLWDSISELRSSLCERTVLRLALLPVKTAQFTQFFRQVWRHTVKSLSLTESVQGALHLTESGSSTCAVWIFNPVSQIVKLDILLVSRNLQFKTLFKGSFVFCILFHFVQFLTLMLI